MLCPSQCICFSNGDVIFDLLIKVVSAGFIHHKYTNYFPLKFVSIYGDTSLCKCSIPHHITHHYPLILASIDDSGL